MAFNGHHIYWSQMARMYSMLCLLGLLSTLLWLQLMRQSKPDPLREILYVIVSLIGVFTEILFWPFLAAQILWTVIHQRSPDKTSLEDGVHPDVNYNSRFADVGTRDLPIP
ncbi:MAG: hypothetical protein WKF84_22895 [Pyrinomonadaceae bacterium]